MTGAVGAPQTAPEQYPGVFFTGSADSRQAGQETLSRVFGARTEDRDEATGWATGEAQARLTIYPDAAHGFLFQHHGEFAADVTEFLA